jgi:hypothetical protein
VASGITCWQAFCSACATDHIHTVVEQLEDSGSPFQLNLIAELGKLSHFLLDTLLRYSLPWNGQVVDLPLNGVTEPDQVSEMAGADKYQSHALPGLAETPPPPGTYRRKSL